MSSVRSIVLCLALVAMLPARATARDATPAKKPSPEVASFRVDGLDRAPVVKKLARALTGHPGVETSKVDNGRFTVRYDANLTTAEAIRAKLAAAEPGITLDPVQPAEPPPPPTPVFKPEEKGCGGCPLHDSCGK